MQCDENDIRNVVIKGEGGKARGVSPFSTTTRFNN
jgi:hypothetical protein